METKINFLEEHKNQIELSGFWKEVHPAQVFKAVELTYVTDVIRDYCVTGVENISTGFIVKWQKRFEPLTKEELKEKYNR